MEYKKTVFLKDGRVCTLRNGMEADGQALLDIYILTHAQTDYLLSYPDETTMTAEQEAVFLKEKTDSADEIEMLAEVEGAVVGSAGIGCVGRKEKTRHRAEFGISIDQAYWGLGIGRALTEACIECAKRAGYAQPDCPRPVQKRRIRGVRQESERFSLPLQRLAGAGAHAPGAGQVSRTGTMDN